MLLGINLASREGLLESISIVVIIPVSVKSPEVIYQPEVRTIVSSEVGSHVEGEILVDLVVKVNHSSQPPVHIHGSTTNSCTVTI